MRTEKLSYREFSDELNRVGGSREFLRNLEGWTDEELWDQLPDQDPRYAGTEETLEDRIADLLGDVPYKDMEENGMSTKTEHCANCGGHLTEENIRLAVEDATGIPREDLIFYCLEYGDERCPGWAKEDETKTAYWVAR